MTELSTAEAAVVQRFEAAADAEESLRARVARAIAVDVFHREITRGYVSPDDCRLAADAAIAVMRGTA